MRVSLDFWSPSLAEFPALGACWKNVAGSQVTQLCVCLFLMLPEKQEGKIQK